MTTELEGSTAGRHRRKHPRTSAVAVVVVSLTAGTVAAHQSSAPVAADNHVFQTAVVSDQTGPYLTFPFEIEEGEGPPDITPIDASMSSTFSDIVVIPGGGLIGGDALEFNVTITNTSENPNALLSAFAFQSKFSESPALASRIGDKAFYATLESGAIAGQMSSVKKNGTSNGLYTGKWKGICINSSVDFLQAFNSGLQDESLECAGNRADVDADGDPDLLSGDAMRGLWPGESQTVRIRIEAGTTDGALHVVQPGTLRGRVVGTPQTSGGLTYFVPTIDNTGIADSNVLAIPDFGDNKVLRNADGTFNPTFAPQAGPDLAIGTADDYTFAGQQYLTLPRPNAAFTDLIGRNHTCATYGLTIGACAGGGSPSIGLLGIGDLVPAVQNFAAILRGFGEFYDADGDFVPDDNPLIPGDDPRPSFPYDVPCENCGGAAYTPIAEFYLDHGDGSLTRQMVAGHYGDPVMAPYAATIDSLDPAEISQEIIPEPDPGGPCIGGGNRPACAQLGGRAEAEFSNLTVVPGMGINGGDAVEFDIAISNTSAPGSNAYLTAFNYQTKRRGLADIGVLDGYTQDRRDIRVDSTRPACTSLADEACYNASLGVGHFPNVIGNGLLFGQMVWTNNDAGREGPVISDQVHVDPVNGRNPVPFWLESVKKNGPFTPILKGNVNFICVKSGLFDNDPDADAACAGEPAILDEPDEPPTPGNVTQRLGIPPGQTQTVRIRMEFGDFRGAMLQVATGTLTPGNVDPSHAATGGLARFFDCSDQRELEYCHPSIVGRNIGYLPNTSATWLTPTNLSDIEYVIVNQPGDAPSVMNFQENFGYILAMAGFVPGAEFYAPDPNPDLTGTQWEGVLIGQQVLGSYGTTEVPPTMAITSAAVVSGQVGSAYTYDVNAASYPGGATFSLDNAPAGMSINGSSGVISWTPTAVGSYPVIVRAGNGAAPDATQSFAVAVSAVDSAQPSSAIVSPRNKSNVAFGIVTVRGTSSDDVAVASVRLTIQDTKSRKYLRPDGRWGSSVMELPTTLAVNGTWAWTGPLPLGSFKATSRAVDTAGKVQRTPATTTFKVIDATRPTSTITKPMSGSTVKVGAVAFAGSASDDVKVASVGVTIQNRSSGKYLQANGIWTSTKAVLAASYSASRGTWSLTKTLPKGEFTVSSIAKDGAGNTQSPPAAVSFKVR